MTDLEVDSYRPIVAQAVCAVHDRDGDEMADVWAQLPSLQDLRAAFTLVCELVPDDVRMGVLEAVS